MTASPRSTVEMSISRLVFRHLAASARLPVACSLAFVSTTAFPDVPPDFEQARSLCLALKAGSDPRAPAACARILSRHPTLRGFTGVVTPAPRSSPDRKMHLALCRALVSQGVGSTVLPLVRRTTAVPSSRLLRRQGLPGVPFEEHVRTMEADPSDVEGSAILLVDDVFTTGTTLRAAAAVLRRGGFTGEIWGAAVGYSVPSPVGNPYRAIHLLV